MVYDRSTYCNLYNIEFLSIRINTYNEETSSNQNSFYVHIQVHWNCMVQVNQSWTWNLNFANVIPSPAPTLKEEFHVVEQTIQQKSHQSDGLGSGVGCNQKWTQVIGRGGEWYPENRGSRKILAWSRNLGNISTKSRRLIFFLFGSEIAWISGSDFQTRVLASRQVLDFTIRHPYWSHCFSAVSLSSPEATNLCHVIPFTFYIFHHQWWYLKGNIDDLQLMAKVSASVNISLANPVHCLATLPISVSPAFICWFQLHIQVQWYMSLVYTTQVNSDFRVIWLVPQSRDIEWYSPPCGFGRKKLARETHFIRKWSNYLGIGIKLVLYILKQLFASVSVNSGGYLPHRSGSVNIHRCSPLLRRIIVN